MITKLLRYLMGVLRQQITVHVENTDDTLNVERDLGRDMDKRWSGTIRVLSRRKRIHLEGNRWWVPTWQVDAYGVEGEIQSLKGQTVVLPCLVFPNILPLPIITSRLSHSVAIELFFRTVVALGEEQ